MAKNMKNINREDMWHLSNENIFRNVHNTEHAYASHKAKNDFFVGFPEFFEKKERKIGIPREDLSEINAQNYFRITR